MKKLLSLILIVLLINNVLGQESNKIELIEFNQSQCDNTSDPYRIKPRIISINHFKDTLDLEIGFAYTCCVELIPNLNYNADTLNITYNVKDGSIECSCICCYSFEHKIKGINSNNVTIKLFNQIIEISNEKYKTYTEEFKIVKKDTVNRKDKYGLKQGIWITTKSNNYMSYKDNNLIKWGELYKKMRIKTEYEGTTNLVREFYKNGQLKKQCKTIRTTENCRYWKSNGIEIVNK